MGSPLERSLAWLTAFLVVFSLYGHTVLNANSADVTPWIAAGIAATMGVSSLLWTARPTLPPPGSASRISAALALWAAWMAFAAIGLLAFADRAPSARDWGLFFLQIGTPVLLLFSNARGELLKALGAWCIAFAMADAVANLGALAGIWQLADAGARYANGVRIERLGGLTGNSHGTGLVALIAACALAASLRDAKRNTSRAGLVLILLTVAVSLYVTDARRYIGGAAAAVVLILVPAFRRAPLQLVSAAIGGLGLWFTFTSDDFGEHLRSNLMFHGWRDAAQHLWVGEGVFYRAPPNGNQFNDLWAANVTESGVLDMAISFGWAATAAFLFAALCGLGAWRTRVGIPAALLTVLAGEMTYANPLDGFLGAIAFFTALLIVICDEAYSPTNAGNWRPVQQWPGTKSVPAAIR